MPRTGRRETGAAGGVQRPSPASATYYCFANSDDRSRNALNSRALPEGSRKNIVACSPGSPWKRTWGSMTKRACRRRAGARRGDASRPSTARRRNAAPEPHRRRPRCAISRADDRARDARRSGARRDRSRSTRSNCALRGSRAARRRTPGRRRDRARGRRDGRAACQWARWNAALWKSRGAGSIS